METENPGNALPNMLQQLKRAVIGQDEVLEQMLTGLIAGGHVLLEGLPGLGKTLMVRSLAQTFTGDYSRIQFTPDLMPADITGHSVFNPQTGEFSTRRGPVFTNILLADEINRAPAKTQAALLEVMQEHQVTLDGETRAVGEPFMVVATQNPVELEGTYPLPEAQLDRFLMKVVVDYPSDDSEVALVKQRTSDQSSDRLDVSQVQGVVSSQDILGLQQQAATMLVDDRLIDYAVKIVRETRHWPGIAYGASPRAAIALIRIARAAAMVAGRDFVIPDDVKRAAPAVLRHRIRLTAEYEIEGHRNDDLIQTLLEQVEAPRE